MSRKNLNDTIGNRTRLMIRNLFYYVYLLIYSTFDVNNQENILSSGRLII